MIADLYLNEVFSHNNIMGGGGNYNSLDFIINAVYENQITIQRSEIDLLEYNNKMLLEGTSYIHEGAGEAIKNFFIKIKDAISKLIHKVIDFFKRIFKKDTSDYKATAKEIKDSKMTIADVNNAIETGNTTASSDNKVEPAAQPQQPVQWYRFRYDISAFADSMNAVADLFDVEKSLHDLENNGSNIFERGVHASKIHQYIANCDPAELAMKRANAFINKRYKIQKTATSIPELRELIFDRCIIKVDKPDQLTTDDIEELVYADGFVKQAQYMVNTMGKMNKDAEKNFDELAKMPGSEPLIPYYKKCAILASQYAQIIAVLIPTFANMCILKLNQTKRLARKALSAYKIANRTDVKKVKAVL